MSKKVRRERKNQNQIDLNTIKAIATLKGVDMAVLNEYPMHLRISGFKVYDYWPSTQRAWEYGTDRRSSTTVPPTEVIDLVL